MWVQIQMVVCRRNGSTETTVNLFHLPNTNASKVTVSHNHSMYLDVNGSLWGTGANNYGELGWGTILTGIFR